MLWCIAEMTTLRISSLQISSTSSLVRTQASPLSYLPFPPPLFLLQQVWATIASFGPLYSSPNPPLLHSIPTPPALQTNFFHTPPSLHPPLPHSHTPNHPLILQLYSSHTPPLLLPHSTSIPPTFHLHPSHTPPPSFSHSNPTPSTLQPHSSHTSPVDRPSLLYHSAALLTILAYSTIVLPC